jgi:hypothetical protein
LAGDEKKNKIAASFVTSPVKIAAFGFLAAILFFFSLAGFAQAETPGTGWEAYSEAFPTNLHPGGSGVIQIDMFNTGAAPSSSSESITVTDTLPPGLEATKAGGMLTNVGKGGPLSPEEEESLPYFGGARWVCTGNGSGKAGLTGATVLTCKSNPGILGALPTTVFRSEVGRQEPSVERLAIAVKVDQAAPEGTRAGVEGNHVAITGGGAASAADALVSDPVTVSSQEAGFGFPGWDAWFTNADGTLDTQAGSHPYAATFVNGFNELSDGQRADGEPRDLEAVLPAGFFGDPGAVPRCPRTQLDEQRCPAQSQIGTDTIGLATGGPGVSGVGGVLTFPVFNMVPPPGIPDEFAFSIKGREVIFDAGVRSSRGYPIVEHIDNIPQAQEDLNALTLWGVPAEAGHDPERCETFIGRAGFAIRCGVSSGVLPKPFLTLPTSCEEPGEPAPAFTLLGLSTWEDPNARAEKTIDVHDNTDTPTGFTGCEKLSIEPSLSAVPDTGFADTPAGLTAEVRVPQENLENPEGLVAATLKNTSVTLPEGMVINPGQAAGLQACQAAEANLEGEGPQSCPAASKVGTVKIQTPILEEQLEPELEGDVYVLQSNPPELKLLLAASADGIYLKLVGTVQLNSATGRLTATFTETPELPFTDFKLSFSGGAQAALATPTQCGSYSTSSDFTPWTSPFTADVLGSDGFSISGGPLGAACASDPLPFDPSLIAGATNPKGGAFTSFSLLLQRGDDQQRIEGLQFKAPAGLSGMISRVPLCTNAQAETNTCPESSKIGHTVVESGPGPYPLVVPEPGQEPAPIYLTGPYNGSGACTAGESGCAPFGLSIVVPLHVGPFTLETQRVRARIEIDPHTAAITVTTNPLPQVIDGVPTDLREVDAVIERPEFMFNPTHCEPSSFSGTATGTPPPGAGGAGATAAISTPFDLVGCSGLKFSPKFTASTSGKTSKAKGASLTLKLTRETGPASDQANFAFAKVELPKQLPSRLTTLQKACIAATFEANPAGCPAASDIGHVKVLTPELPVPLEGPAYFVSHGGEAFPSVIVVLQGDGVTIDVVSTTFISKSGITSATIKTVPDQPFTSFELTFPEGAYSALAANGNLCAQTKTVTAKHRVTKRVHGKTVHRTVTTHTTKPATLQIPTEFVAQNGSQVHQNTPVNVTGCSKTKPAKKAVKHKKAKKRK